MAKVGAGFMGLAMLLAVAGAVGCQIASPTYITSQEAPIDADAGEASAPPSTTPDSENAPASSGGTCTDFVTPDLSTLTACGGGKGHCFDRAKVVMGDQFAACPDPSMACVPDEILKAGGDKLPSCTSIIGPGGCVTTSLIPPIQAQGGSALKQDACTAGQLCVPCTDPTHGNAPTPFCQPIGASSHACTGGGSAGDAGAMPACCTTHGKSNGVCIAETAIPENQRNSAIQDTCSGSDKCVPASLVQGEPTACDGGAFGGGVCIDKCFSGMLALAGDVGLLPTDGCGATEVCVACVFLSGRGVPGCP